MKIVIIFLVIVVGQLSAQNYEPAQRPFNILGNSNYYIHPDSTYFSLDDQFVWGWQWSYDKSLTRALQMNFGLSKVRYWNNLNGYIADGDTTKLFSPLVVYDSTVSGKRFNFIVELGHLTGQNYYKFTNLQSVQFEPTLIENDTITNYPRVLDEQDPIFGFEHILGDVSSIPTDENYSRLVLKSSEHSETIILGKNDFEKVVEYKPTNSDTSITYISHNRFDNLLYYLVPKNKPHEDQHNQSEHISTLKVEDYNGKKWFLSINLRRLNSDSTTKDSEEILKIRLPWISETFKTHSRFDTTGNYVYYNVDNIQDSILIKEAPIDHSIVCDSVVIEIIEILKDATKFSYIKFDEVPSNIANDTNHIDWEDNRGIIHNSTPTVAADEIVITRNMLPLHSDSHGPDVTLICKFTCDGIDTTVTNPMLKNGISAYPNIKNLGIEVEYLGVEDVAIDWIRLEMPGAQMLYEGMIDDAVVDHLEGFWQQVAVDSFMNKGIYFPRLHDRHEYPSMAHFGPVRYFNKLIGGIVVSETDAYDEERYHRYVGTNSRWPITWGTQWFWSVPYFRKGDPYPLPENASLIGLKYGFAPPDNPKLGNQDTLLSAWETFINTPYGYTLVPDLTYLNNIYNPLNEDFWTYVTSSDSYLARKEADFYRGFYKHRYMFYSKKSLWTQTQIYSHFGSKKSEPYEIHYLYGQTMTKEQVNSSLWWNLIHGAKGQLFDGSYSSDFFEAALNINDAGDTLGGATQIMSKLYHNQNYLNINNLDTLTSWDLIDIDHIGSDFVAESDTSEWTRINQKLNYDSLSKYYGMKEDRFYLGRKTHRRELLKTISFIDEVDSTLLDLRMQAFYWKGLVTYLDHHPTNFQYYDQNVLKEFIDLKNIRTRRLFRPNLDFIHNTNPDLENRDSSFFDLTMLNNKNQKTTQYKYNPIYLGILNRRTDPLIFNDSLGVKGEMHFYSGAEFDEYVQSST